MPRVLLQLIRRGSRTGLSFAVRGVTIVAVALWCVCSCGAVAGEPTSVMEEETVVEDSTRPMETVADWEMMTLPPTYTAIPDHLPEDILPLLPDGLFSEDAEEAMNATRELTTWESLLRVVLEAVGLRLGDAVSLFGRLCGLVLVAAVLGKLREAIGGRTGELCGLCLRLVLYAAVITETVGMVELVQDYFVRLRGLTGGMIPAMGVLYALGGNLGQAAIGEELLLVFLAVCEYIGTTVTPPVCAVCLVAALTEAIGSRLNFTAMAEQIKKGYAALLGLIMFGLSLALSAQSVLASRADSLAMRGAKYAVGSIIPVVGGAVSGTLGTMAESVRLLRGVCGVSGVVLVLLLLLPTVVELLLLRAALRLGAMVATLLGCEGEARLLSSVASLHGYLVAAAAMASVMFLLSLTLLIHSAVAIA